MELQNDDLIRTYSILVYKTNVCFKMSKNNFSIFEVSLTYVMRHVLEHSSSIHIKTV